MSDTKERILKTALRLFAANGYEAVSVSDIASALSITKGALYKHYANKRGIFDAILSRMAERDAQGAAASELPTESAEAAPETYCNIPPAQIIAYAKAQFRYWTQDEFAADFRRMLTLEQFRSREMTALYQQYLAAGPLAYTADLLRANGFADAEEKAAAIYGPMFLFYSIYDACEDKSDALAQLDACLDRVFPVPKQEKRGNRS